MKRLEVFGVRNLPVGHIDDLALLLPRDNLRRLEILGLAEKHLTKFFAECKEVKELRIKVSLFFVLCSLCFVNKVLCSLFFSQTHFDL